MWGWNRQMWEKKNGTIKCDKSTVQCDIGAVELDNGTIKCEKKKKGNHQMWQKNNYM